MVEDLTAEVSVGVDGDGVEVTGEPGDSVLLFGDMGVEYEVDGEEAGRTDYLLIGIKDADYWDVTTVPPEFILDDELVGLEELESWIIENRAPNADEVLVKAVIAPETVVYEAR